MQATIKVQDVSKRETRAGNTRYVVTGDDGTEYTTFRPQIGEQAEGFTGKRARIEFHEEQRGNFKNVYLDKIALADDEPANDNRAVAAVDADEAAWHTAAEVAPLLVGKHADPDELFDALKPFKDRVADDIRGTKK